MSEPAGAAGAGLPEAAGRRLSGGAWSSGLSVADFAACASLGLRPVALVQGFCAMQWSGWSMGAPARTATAPSAGPGPSPYSAPSADRPGGAYSQSWPCPHGFASLEHRWGYTFEQVWVEEAWAAGFGSAYRRMAAEAEEAGADGVVGVSDSAEVLTEQNVIEFHLVGTAVAVEDPRPPAGPARPARGPAGPLWSTYLAGQRLAKLFEAGLAPVSVAAAMASVQLWPNCQTEYMLQGAGAMWGGSPAGEVMQVVEAETAVRRLVRAAVRAQLGPDSLQGARFSVTRRGAGGGHVVECTLRGTRVRRFKDFDPLGAPRPTLRLS
jgi:uncharacterized protein YbjQ (UPF0145 family)